MPKYRGKLLIHVSSWFDLEEVHDDFGIVEDGLEAEQYKDVITNMPYGIKTYADLRKYCGHIVGLVDLVNIEKAVDVECSRSGYEWIGRPFGEKHIVFSIKDPVLFDRPIPCKGRLGIFYLKKELFNEQN